jgi:hypothetical protein
MDQPTKNAEARIRKTITSAPLQPEDYDAFKEATGKDGAEAEVRAFIVTRFDKKQAEQRA